MEMMTISWSWVSIVTERVVTWQAYWNVENYLKALPTLDIVQVQEIGMQSIEPTL